MTSNPFPLIYLQKNVILVDDSMEFLQMVAMHLNDECRYELFDSPQQALDFIRSEVPIWRSSNDAISHLLSLGENAQSLVRHLLEDRFNLEDRSKLHTVLFVDFTMPQMNGLQLIEQLEHWPGKIVLLTGEATDQVAITAFNRGLIHRFIPKTLDVPTVVNQYLDDLHLELCHSVSQYVEPILSSHQIDLLSNKHVARALAALVKDLGWREYITTGSPLGILGAKEEGSVEWLQIETADTLPELLAIMKDYKFDKQQFEEVASGHALTNMEIQAQLGMPPTTELAPAHVLTQEPLLYYSVWPIQTVL